MLHEKMDPDQQAYFEAEGTCPKCRYEPLKRGINLKEGWWLCRLCETWWRPDD
jgi:ribosomal protein L37AE/L43A